MDTSHPTARVTPAYRAISFSPVNEPGWVVAIRSEEHPPEANVLDIWPVVGFMLYEVTDIDGLTYPLLHPVTDMMDVDPELHTYGQVVFNRGVFRESFSGTLQMTRAQLKAAVSQ